MPPAVPLTLACLLQAAASQALPPQVMFGLLATEGGWVGASIGNNNGSHDLGPLQVNDDAWLGTVARRDFGGDREAARWRLQWDGCYNAGVSAWIFRGNLDEAGGDLSRAVGYYNSHTPDKMAAYQRTFARRFVSLYGGQLATAPIPAR